MPSRARRKNLYTVSRDIEHRVLVSSPDERNVSPRRQSAFRHRAAIIKKDLYHFFR